MMEEEEEEEDPLLMEMEEMVMMVGPMDPMILEVQLSSHTTEMRVRKVAQESQQALNATTDDGRW